MKKYILIIIGLLVLIYEIFNNSFYASGDSSWNIGYIIGSLVMYLFAGILIYEGIKKLKNKK